MLIRSLSWSLAAALLTAVPAQAQTAQQHAPFLKFDSGTERMTIAEAKAHYPGPLAQVVLQYLTVMEQIVNKDKEPKITKADWEPLGRLVDRDKFRRVGNFGVRNNWDSYSQLLAGWAGGSWWKGYIWRLREVPGALGQPDLVYVETEERSNNRHPVRDDGDYAVFPSIAVYEIDASGKIVSLHVYDQAPRQ